MHPTVKITYFDFPGRAEACRLTCEIGGIPYEDDRIQLEEWPGRKATMPYGVVPVITIDGHQGVESCAILRYVGKLADLYPTDPLQALFVDEVIDIIESVARCLDRYHGPDKARLIAERTQCAEKDFPYLLGTLEKRLQAFGKGAYVVGNTISVADVAIASLIRNVKLERWLYLPKQCVDSYTTMNSISENVYAHPNAVAYCKRLENKKYMLV